MMLHNLGDFPRALGDWVQLQQVLINLAMNGIDAMDEITDRPRELIITSAKYADGALVTVHDSGTGSTPITQTVSSNRCSPPNRWGIGMGLSISWSIIESHGGRLWTAPLSDGALFQFTVPADGINNK